MVLLRGRLCLLLLLQQQRLLQQASQMKSCSDAALAASTP